MKLFIGCVFIAAMLVLGAAEGDEVHVVQQGVDIDSRQETPARQEELAAKVIALAESASVESTGYVECEKRWKKTLSQPRFVHALFDPARDVKLMVAYHRTHQLTPVNEIRIVLSERGWTDHILVRVGSQIRAVTKYSPCRMAELIVGAKLRTSTQEHAELLSGYCVDPK
ncbi:hypothetical protein GCM10011487_60670 [Steroidobacter agaridevorans]|uniref:Uncharacterized protein n=1 Tax=Steroidobacter agaridevorans TaxID=2695856 RepID=A0A829YL23_9GAMM|nr:hypothetical protein [Steroidobacter agaridevorans]GFE84067.1 hypothetical protein GCM10011487_60670 [Steroidobacter agaridevorans]